MGSVGGGVESSRTGDQDAVEFAKVAKKLEGAKVRVAEKTPARCTPPVPTARRRNRASYSGRSSHRRGTPPQRISRLDPRSRRGNRMSKENFPVGAH